MDSMQIITNAMWFKRWIIIDNRVKTTPPTSGDFCYGRKTVAMQAGYHHAQPDYYCAKPTIIIQTARTFLEPMKTCFHNYH